MEFFLLKEGKSLKNKETTKKKKLPVWIWTGLCDSGLVPASGS